MAWEGDRAEGHNRFRRHILEYHTPRINGQLVPDLYCFPTWGGMKTENHLKLIETIRKERLPYNCYWIDAGWYGPPHECEEYQNLLTEDWFFNVGDWQVNTMVHPKGLKPISDAAHKAGMKFLLWFDQERAVGSCKTVVEHPDWYFRRITETTLVGRKANIRIFNFGNPDARRWMTEFISGQITELGIDVFRNDGNFGANRVWDEEDTPDRIGISEIRYVEGLNEFWDELRRRFPHLILDIVQRRDLETISRAVDLSRADYNFVPGADPTGNQVSLHGISHWIPLSGTGALTLPGDTYNQLSAFSSSLPMSFFAAIGDKPVIPRLPDDYPLDWHRNIMELHKKAGLFFRGDYYPLLESSTSPDVWAAMQFHRTDLDAGMVIFYRRPLSPYTSATFPLHGLSADGNYLVELNSDSTYILKGSELMHVGLQANAELPRTANIIFYKRVIIK
jgi:alpha-galactosidase